MSEHVAHDLVTTLRSELAASTYKRDRMMAELQDAKHGIRSRDAENESLKSQLARQSALINSLQERLKVSEAREKQLQANSETNHHTFHREKKLFEEQTKDLTAKLRHLEHDLQVQKNCTDDVKYDMFFSILFEVVNEPNQLQKTFRWFRAETRTRPWIRSRGFKTSHSGMCHQ